MRILTAGLGLVALALLGLVAFAVLNLRALVGVHQDRLVARVERVLGRSVAVGAVSPSWWPLGIRLRDVTVGEDPTFGSAPFLTAEGIVLGVRAWPLVRGRIEASGVTLEGPRLSVVCAANGRWNVESLGASRAREPAGGSAPRGRRTGLRVPIEWVVGLALGRVREGTITIDDRRLGAAAPFVLRHVSVRATDLRVGASARIGVEAALFAANEPDVRLDLRADALGERDAEHTPFSARVEIDDAELAPLSERLGRPRLASGRLRRLALVLEGTLARLRATLAVEAVDPAVRIGALPFGALRPIALRARVRRDGAAAVIEDLHAAIGSLVVRGSGEATLDPRRASLVLRSEGEGAAELALGERTVALRAVAGRLVIEPAGVSFAPLALEIDDVPVSLRGGVAGVDPPAIDLRIESRPFGGTLAADVAVEATGAARARVEAAAIDLGSATARLVPELAGRVEGRGGGAAAFTGRIAAGALVAGSLAGSGTLAVADGRLREVNLPGLVVAEVEALPFMPRLVSASTRERYRELFGGPDTVVESATLPFAIARGRLTTERAVLVNPAYQIAGDGWLDETRALRFRGTVLLGASVSRTLHDDVRAAKYLATEDGRIALPFVARGRLGAVRIEPDAKRLRARGLEALLGASDTTRPSPGADAERRDRRRDERVEDRVIERLERLLRP
ncbi:MAG: AsmA family protein [Deltaproteobacteria bacterium]|nr:AsmA family protein [Deltaproteobacteria bacterium]